MEEFIIKYPIISSLIALLVFFIAGLADLVSIKNRFVALAIWLAGVWFVSYPIVFSSYGLIIKIGLLVMLLAAYAFIVFCIFLFLKPPSLEED